MNRKNYAYTLVLALLSATAFSSCERATVDDLSLGRNSAHAMKVNVLSSDFETKSSSEAVQTRTFGDEDFSITEYVGRISDATENPGTKGTEITTDKINQAGKKFKMEGYGMVSAKKGDPEVATHHIDGLTTSYSGGTWVWDNGADPKWINHNNLHLWSLYPVGEINPTINWSDENPAENTATFTSYTAGNTDLLLAYNKESREFVKDSKDNHTYDANGILIDDIIGEPTVDIKFCHALAEVRFMLETTTDGADVHSITLCHVGTDGNIVTSGAGIATTGDCVATGTGDGTGTVSFAWSNQGTKKPIRYEFDNTQSVKGGFANTGDGVKFVIPQTVQSNDIKIIVQFSKYGGSNYYTKVLNLPNVEWKAGYYYKYKLKIGEFHVPGERLTLENVDIQGLQTKKGQTGFLRPEDTGMSVKGVKYVGLVLNYWMLGSKDGQTVYLNGVKDGTDQVPGLPDSVPSNPTFSYDFAPVSDSPLPNTNNKIYSFGGGGEETYSKFNSFGPPSGPNKSAMGLGYTGPFYYVFDSSGANRFQVIFKPAAGDNSGGFFGSVKCMLVLEVEEDSNLPGNFDDIDWSQYIV